MRLRVRTQFIRRPISHVGDGPLGLSFTVTALHLVTVSEEEVQHDTNSVLIPRLRRSRPDTPRCSPAVMPTPPALGHGDDCLSISQACRPAASQSWTATPLGKSTLQVKRFQARHTAHRIGDSAYSVISDTIAYPSPAEVYFAFIGRTTNCMRWQRVQQATNSKQRSARKGTYDRCQARSMQSSEGVLDPPGSVRPQVPNHRLQSTVLALTKGRAPSAIPLSCSVCRDASGAAAAAKAAILGAPRGFSTKPIHDISRN